MCFYLLIIISITSGFLIAQGTKLFNYSIQFGAIFSDFKLNIARKEATKNEDLAWFEKSLEETEILTASDAAIAVSQIYDYIGRHSKRMRLYDCIYCMSARASAYISLPLSIVMALAYCPLYLLLIISIPIITYTITDVL